VAVGSRHSLDLTRAPAAIAVPEALAAALLTLGLAVPVNPTLALSLMLALTEAAGQAARQSAAVPESPFEDAEP
jgi:hypothetical protein